MLVQKELQGDCNGHRKGRRGVVSGSIDRESGDSITHLKLQKLVYYAQAWSLACMATQSSTKICRLGLMAPYPKVFTENSRLQLERTSGTR